MVDYARRSARVILLDENERVLLFNYLFDGENPAMGNGWFTPGGGVDPGESLRETAIRELAEETGLVISADALGPHVAFTTGYAELGWITGHMRDDFFLHRVTEHEVDLGGMLDYETRNLLAHRWWTVDGLRKTNAMIMPLRLADVVERLIAGDIPDEPIELPWHH